MMDAPRRERRKTQDRITIEALTYYVPLFQLGARAEERILQEEALSPQETNLLETQARLKDLVTRKIAELSGPLITSELNKIIQGSHLAYSDDLFDLLYYAGLAGMQKGLMKFDATKMKASATNYLFQWITVYAKRELTILEAPFGIAPSRFQKYKKISAVRKRMAANMGKAPTNEEIFEYFQSGQADIKTFHGRVGKNPVGAANRNITMELILEQEEFEHKFMVVNLLDPQEDYSSNLKLSKAPQELFSETIFGAFIEDHNVTVRGRAVLLSELGSEFISPADARLASTMDVKEYQAHASAWKALIKDSTGPFCEFLKSVRADNFSQFDIESTLQIIESSNRSSSGTAYAILFENSTTAESKS